MLGLKQWRSAWRGEQIPPSLWRHTLADCAVLQGLSTAEQEQLKTLVELFLRKKRFIPQDGLELDPGARLLISAQACLPILNLGLNFYRGWSSIIVYPDRFWTWHQQVDAAGIVQQWREPRSGEAWPQGPVVLSWADVLASGEGFNVVIHELAHKIDMLNGGEADGFPSLHRDMQSNLWTQVFSRAYQDFQEQVQAGLATPFDLYAAETPGEFFAVLSEVFFDSPQVLRGFYPQVYAQLKAFYRQDPAGRLALVSG